MPKLPRDKKYRAYNISSNRFRELQYFAWQYNEWKDELHFKYDTAKAVTITDMPQAHNYEGNSTADAAIECAELQNKIDIVESSAMLADPDLYPYILKAVTDRNINFNYLMSIMNIPCSRNTFYNRRRRFYWILSSKLKYTKSE